MGFRALSWSIRTDGLFALRPGWSNHLMILWCSLRPYEHNTISCSSAYGSSAMLGLWQSEPMVSTNVEGSLESTQWNLVRGIMTWLTAKVALML